MNSDEYLDRLVAAARNQGNGLKKLQLYEYRQVLLPDWRILPKRTISAMQKVATALIKDEADYKTVRAIANRNIKYLLYAKT
jgi:hypothetical protein